MRLIEVKILYNADYHTGDVLVLNLQDHIQELMYWARQRPDVINISKITLLDNGDEDAEG